MIYAYTRAQAIADGVLVDVSEIAKESDIKLPTAITAAVHTRYVAVPKELKGQQDEAGRLWDLVYMFAQADRKRLERHETQMFTLRLFVCRGAGVLRQRNQQFKGAFAAIQTAATVRPMTARPV